LAAAEAWAAVCSACALVVFIQVMYGSTAATIVADVGPSHSSSKTSIADWYWVAADSSSAASRFHAADAVRIGAEPGPEYILAEFISGGNAPKSMVSVPNRPESRRRRRQESSVSVYTIGRGRPLLQATAPALQQRTSQLSFQ